MANRYSAEALEALLGLVDSPVPLDIIRVWDAQQKQDAGDWAMRTHLRASDNNVRVPTKPAHVAEAVRYEVVPATGTVMDIAAGRRTK